MAKNTLSIGTRGSALALWQAEWVKTQIKGRYPQFDFKLVKIKTEALKDGMITLHEGAIRKMLDGETTVSEVLRVTGVGEDLIS